MEEMHYILKDKTAIVLYFSFSNMNKFVVMWEGIYIGYFWMEKIDLEESEIIWRASSPLLEFYLKDILDSMQNHL